MLSEDELEAITSRNSIRRQIHNAASPAPWQAGDTSEGLVVCGPDPEKAADMIFVAHARNDNVVADVDALLKHVVRLEAVADAADDLLHNAFGTEECFNPSTYEVEAEYILALRNALAALQS